MLQCTNLTFGFAAAWLAGYVGRQLFGTRFLPIVDRSSPTKHRLAGYSMILVCWSSSIVQPTSPNLLPSTVVQSNREASPGCSVHWLCRRQK